MQADLLIAIEPPRQPGVIRLLELSNAYAESLYPAESNHMLPLDELEQDSVSFFVARIGDTVLGCASLVRHADGTAEIKLESADRANGYWTTRIDTDPDVRARTSGVYWRADPGDLDTLDGRDNQKRAELIAERLAQWKSIKNA